MRSFYITLISLSVVIGLGGLLLQWLDVIVSLPSFFWISLSLLFVTVGIIYRFLYTARQEMFVQLFLLTMVFKLIAYVSYNLIVILLDKGQAAANVIFFMLVYLVFTVLEIAFLYPKINR